MQAVPAIEIVTHRVVWSFVFLVVLTLVQHRWDEFVSASVAAHPAHPVRHDPAGERQLAALHLGRQRRIPAAGQPRLLHQPAGQCPARGGLSEGAAAPAPGRRGLPGAGGRGHPDRLVRPVPLDCADPRLQLRRLRSDPQGGPGRLPRRVDGRDVAADSDSCGRPGLLRNPGGGRALPLRRDPGRSCCSARGCSRPCRCSSSTSARGGSTCPPSACCSTSPPVACSCMAVLLYGEPFTVPQFLTFALIWAALAIYSIDSVRSYRRALG